MGTSAIGDIHGCHRALTTLIDFAPIRDDDQLITLGDYVDRGPNARETLDWLVARHESGHLTAALQGSHDRMMLDARKGKGELDLWLDCGGDAVLDSYGIPFDAVDLEKIPSAHWDFLEHTCRPYFETDTHLFVHAGVYPELALEDQPESMLFWERLANRGPHRSGKKVICGHTSQPTGRPADLGHTICIDTRAYSSHGWLTCLNVDTGDYWQVSERGETREERLGLTQMHSAQTELASLVRGRCQPDEESE